MDKGRINTRHMLLTNYGELAYFIAVSCLTDLRINNAFLTSFSNKAGSM